MRLFALNVLRLDIGPLYIARDDTDPGDGLDVLSRTERIAMTGIHSLRLWLDEIEKPKVCDRPFELAWGLDAIREWRCIRIAGHSGACRSVIP
ncbi:MAG: hypothetical protein KGK34_07325 [Chloroflexota bacterium]|nr:hypothetical protein [Chloroflexota bacterium]